MVNKNDAPEGYIALPAPARTCDGCAFDSVEDCPLDPDNTDFPDCASYIRDDGENVIFIKKEEEC